MTAIKRFFKDEFDLSWAMAFVLVAAIVAGVWLIASGMHAERAFGNELRDAGLTLVGKPSDYRNGDKAWIVKTDEGRIAVAREIAGQTLIGDSLTPLQEFLDEQ